MSSRIQDGQSVPTIHGTQTSHNLQCRPLNHGAALDCIT
jgi:hypothetical protein